MDLKNQLCEKIAGFYFLKRTMSPAVGVAVAGGAEVDDALTSEVSAASAEDVRRLIAKLESLQSRRGRTEGGLDAEEAEKRC